MIDDSPPAFVYGTCDAQLDQQQTAKSWYDMCEEDSESDDEDMPALMKWEDGLSDNDSDDDMPALIKREYVVSDIKDEKSPQIPNDALTMEHYEILMTAMSDEGLEIGELDRRVELVECNLEAGRAQAGIIW
jgi:hypothetical protein